jgi:dihydroxy-acid dehydratase
MEDVHRAGGIMAILGELDRAGLLHTDLPTVHSRTLGDALNRWDIKRTNDPKRADLLQRRAGRRADADRVQPVAPLGRARSDREKGVIRSAEHAFSRRTAGLPCCTATSRRDGCIVKTAGVDESILKFTGPRKVYESQDAPSPRS